MGPVLELLQPRPRPPARDRLRLGRIRDTRGEAGRLQGHRPDAVGGAAGLGDHGCRVAARGQDRFGLHDYRPEARQLRGITSIEMFEAVGERGGPVLQPGAGNAGARLGGRLQVITIEDSLRALRRNPDFIQRYIFPAGCCPEFRDRR